MKEQPQMSEGAVYLVNSIFGIGLGVGIVIGFLLGWWLT